MRYLNNIFDAFLGSPRRVMMSTCIGLVIFIWLNPGVIRSIGNSFLLEIESLMVPLLTVSLMFYGIWWLFMGPPNKKGRR